MPKQRLKSNAKNGQSVKARADESTGKRKKELDKISKTDKANYKKAPKRIKQKIKKYYSEKTTSREDNKGRYI